MVMYAHTRNISYQAKKFAKLEEAFKITNVDSYSFDPQRVSENVKKVLDITCSYRRNNDHEKAVGEILDILNKLVNSQRLEAKEDLYTLLKEEDLYTLLKEEEAEDTAND